MRRRLSVAIITSFVIALSGCGSDSSKSDPKHPKFTMLYSPNAEPLRGGPLGEPPCEQALAGWFDRIDGDHDGSISHDEFMADALAQFARMDLNHDGFITPAELSAYRLPYRETPPPTNEADDSETGTPSKPHGGHDKSGAGNGATHGSTGIALDAIDPVMTADHDLKFKVNLDDFMAQAAANFSDLDRQHTGRLTRAEILQVCTPKKD